MWRGLGGGGGRFPTQSGGRGFPLLLLHLSFSVSPGAPGGIGLGVRTPKSRPQPPGSSPPSFPLSRAPFSFLSPPPGTSARVAAGWELRRRGSRSDPCWLPFFLPGSSGPRSSDAQVSLDRGIPPSPRPYTSNQSIWDRMLRERMLAAPSISGDSLPFSLSASLLRALASSWARWLGTWTPGFKPSSVPSLSSLSHLFSLSFHLSLSLPLRDPGLPGPSAPHPLSSGGDSGLRVTGARPFPPSLPGWRARHSPPPPPLPGGGGVEKAEGERPRRRTKGLWRPPPLPPTSCSRRLDLEQRVLGGGEGEGAGSAPQPPKGRA